jgi:YtkA-like
MNTLNAPSASQPYSRRNIVRWLAPLLALIAVLIAIVALLGWQMGVPDDLDLSTSQLTQRGYFEVSYAPTDTIIPINTLHTWTLTVKDSSGQSVENAQIAIDGDMPQHGHGLPTQPQVTQYLGDGQYLVEGVKFQMGGWWVMDFTITANGQTDTVRFNFILK